MRPLVDWPAEARRALVGVFTDIDDTLTTEGAITADALQSLYDLKAAGLRVESNLGSEKIGAKIRVAVMEKIPYQVVVGERDYLEAHVGLQTGHMGAGAAAAPDDGDAVHSATR